jgi:hypothetical protein
MQLKDLRARLDNELARLHAVAEQKERQLVRRPPWFRHPLLLT